MKHKRLLNRRFCALKYNIVLQGSYFTSNGFLVCCSIVILFAYKVVCIVMFKGFMAVSVYGVVGAGNNKVVWWCGGGVVTCKVINRVWIILLVWMVLWDRVWMVGK